MSDTTTPRLWPAGTDPAAWVRSWSQALMPPYLAPQNLVQPILPGWTFNINSSNSSAPQTEADVLQRHSYGRQLGRIADALAVLIAAAPAKVRDAEAVDKFVGMKDEIDRVKQQSALARVERLRSDLDLLKQTDRAEFDRLVKALRTIVDAA